MATAMLWPFLFARVIRNASLLICSAKANNAWVDDVMKMVASEQENLFLVPS